MANTVVAKVLQELRREHGLSLNDLAKKAKVDKKTIHMLERGKRTARKETIGRLSRALGVAEGVLTGLAPRPRPETADPINPQSHFKTRFDAAARNALTLVTLRYEVSARQVVELAPFLFYWAAERSLKRRRERLEAVEQALSQVEDSQKHFPHLPNTGFYHEIESLDYELRSIERRDIFGLVIDEAAIHQSYHYYDADTSNPFATFLNEVAAEIGGAAFGGMNSIGSPAYAVCREDAATLVGGDEEAVEAIMIGAASLPEMLKELKTAPPEERANWAKERMSELQREMDRELDLILNPGGAGK